MSFAEPRDALPPAGALVVIDVQRAFVEGAGAVPEAVRLLRAVDALLDRARAAGVLVAHLQNDGPPSAPDEVGTWGWELARSPGEGEVLVRKLRDSGFDGTDLGEVLARHDVSCVVVAGVQSEMCVAATAREALAKGLKVVLPRDAHATFPIPEVPGRAPAVPAEHVSRVAEWSLGDEVVIADCAADVRFGAADG